MKAKSSRNITNEYLNNSQAHQREKEATVSRLRERERIATAAATHLFHPNFNNFPIIMAISATITITTACRHQRRFPAGHSLTFSPNETVHQTTRHRLAHHLLPIRLRATAHQ